MPRKKRVSRPNMCHHVMLRGIDRRPLFLDDSDRVRFCLLLQEASEFCSFRIHAFCLMTNHIHLMLEPINGSLSKGVHRFSSRYAQHFNKRHKKRGYVFQGRFRSILVEDGSYMRRLVRYIHLNPIDAKMVQKAEHHFWSSYNAYFNRVAYTWLQMDRVLSHFGNMRSEALSNMGMHLEAKMDAELDKKEIEKSFRIGAYGSEEFTEIYADSADCDIDSSKFSGSKLEHVNIDIHRLINSVGIYFNVTMNELSGTDKRRELVNARAVLARAAQLGSRMSVREVGELLNKHPGTISRLTSVAYKDKSLDQKAKELVEALLK